MVSVCGVWLLLPLWAAAATDDQWNFQLTPYGWLAGQKGSAAVISGAPVADIDVDFWDDVLGNINGALFLVGEARKGRWGGVMNGAWIDIEADADTPGPSYSKFGVRSEMWLFNAAGFYRLVDQGDTFVDVLAGFQYWSVETTLMLKAGTAPGQEIAEKEDWIDPVVGVKGKTPLGSSKFFVNGYFNIGGFGAGADFMWDANVNIGYSWTENLSALIGYRYMDVDYEEDGFVYDVAMSGPVIGLTWRF